VLTSNADGMFEQNGYPVEKILTTQGDYANLQCMKPCTPELFPIKPYIEAALPHIDVNGTHEIVKPELIPKCKNCGGPVFMNVRGGSWFLESAQKPQRKKYSSFVSSAVEDARKVNKNLVILEIGVGFNTPSVIRYVVVVIVIFLVEV
jgi:NAD-dependent SIR2 family protein deacetylase